MSSVLIYGIQVKLSSIYGVSNEVKYSHLIVKLYYKKYDGKVVTNKAHESKNK